MTEKENIGRSRTSEMTIQDASGVRVHLSADTEIHVVEICLDGTQAGRIVWASRDGWQIPWEEGTQKRKRTSPVIRNLAIAFSLLRHSPWPVPETATLPYAVYFMANYPVLRAMLQGSD